MIGITSFSTTDDVTLITEAEKIIHNIHNYFIVARTNSGARFYSEYITEDSILEYRKIYRGLVDYFGGGTVELWECSWDAENILFID